MGSRLRPQEVYAPLGPAEDLYWFRLPGRRALPPDEADEALLLNLARDSEVT